MLAVVDLDEEYISVYFFILSAILLIWEHLKDSHSWCFNTERKVFAEDTNKYFLHSPSLHATLQVTASLFTFWELLSPRVCSLMNFNQGALSFPEQGG